MDIWRKVIVCFAIFVTIIQIQGCYKTKKKSDSKGDIILQYVVGSGLLLSDSQAHDVLIVGEKAVNDTYYATPKPDPGTRIS